MLHYNLVSLAKNHNFFGSIDQYMKEFSRIVMKLPNKQLQNRLESALSKEIAIGVNLE